MHLADAFIQSDLQLHSGYTFFLSVCVFPGNWTHNLLRYWRNALPLSHTRTQGIINNSSKNNIQKMSWQNCECAKYRRRFVELSKDVQYCAVLLIWPGGKCFSCVWLFWCTVLCSVGQRANPLWNEVIILRTFYWLVNIKNVVVFQASQGDGEVWYGHPVYARYWQHYQQAMNWHQRHKRAYRKALEVGFFQALYSMYPSADQRYSDWHGDESWGNAHRDRMAGREEGETEATNSDSEVDEESSDESQIECDVSNMDISEELRQYFAQTERHRQELSKCLTTCGHFS